MPGDRITNEGEIELTMYILLKGSVQVVKLNEAKEEVHVATMHRDCVFGELGILGHKRSASIIAMTFCGALGKHYAHCE
jgi:CRP-like cAMP-binding protein